MDIFVYWISFCTIWQKRHFIFVSTFRFTLPRVNWTAERFWLALLLFFTDQSSLDYQVQVRKKKIKILLENVINAVDGEDPRPNNGTTGWQNNGLRSMFQLIIANLFQCLIICFFNAMCLLMWWILEKLLLYAQNNSYYFYLYRY